MCSVCKALSGWIDVARVVSTNREVACQALFRNLELTRCISVGEETECDAQVDDRLTKIEQLDGSEQENREPEVATS